MTDNEIKQALPFLAKYCKNEYNDIRVDEVLLGASDLINRQKAEIKEWKRVVETWVMQHEKDKAEIERFEQIETTINAFWSELQKLSITKEKETPTLEELLEYIEQAKAEAIKEFAERLKERTTSYYPIYSLYVSKGLHEAIDNLVKEMVGDTE